LITIYNEHKKPIPVGIFKTGMELFDSLGRFNFGFYKIIELKDRIADFFNELDYKCYSKEFYSIINYAKNTILNLLSFTEANNIKI